MIRPDPIILPEGNEITKRKSNPERQSLIVEQGTELQLPGGGCLGGSFIALGKAGWGWMLASFYLEGHPGKTGFFRVRGKKVPRPFGATSSSTNHGRRRDSEGRTGVETRRPHAQAWVLPL